MARRFLAAILLLSVFVASPHPCYAISDEEVRLIREIEEIRYTIEHTEWTWANRDQKKVYEDKLALLNRILDRVAQRRFEPTTKSSPDVKHKKARGVGNEEVRLVREIEELKEQIVQTEWRWDNRDQKTSLGKRLEFLEQTLSRIKP
jgi:hypothetical protein